MRAIKLGVGADGLVQNFMQPDNPAVSIFPYSARSVLLAHLAPSSLSHQAKAITAL